jgi:hypothetical protein
MRVLISAIVMAAFLLAGPLSAQTDLPPGKPAGVKQAGVTSERREVLVITGVAVVSAGLAIVLIADKGNSAPTSTTP